jgi:hypothetical protein
MFKSSISGGTTENQPLTEKEAVFFCLNIPSNNKKFDLNFLCITLNICLKNHKIHLKFS